MGICCFSKPPLAFSGSQTSFEFTEVFLGRLFAIHNRMRIVGANDAICVDLDGFGGEVWFVGVLRRKIPEFGNPPLDETGGFGFHVETGFGVGAGVVEPEVWHGKGSHTGKP